MSTRRKTQSSSKSSSKVDVPAILEQPVVDEPPRIFKDEKSAKVEWLKPWHFKPGQSGNPGGRKRKQPMTQALEFAADLPCPPAQKKNLERILGVELPHSLTLVQAAAIGQHIKSVTDTHTASWIADRIDGPLTGRLQVEGPGGAPLLVPNLTLQFVEVSADGKVIRTIELEPPPPIGADPPKPPEPMPAESGDGSSDAATKLSSSNTK